MSDPASTKNYPQTLPFPMFGSASSVLKMPVLRVSPDYLQQAESSPGNAHRETPPEQRIASRYHVDVYGQPRILSKLEIVLYALARPVVVGVLIGFGLAIFLHGNPHPPTFKSHESISRPLVATWEMDP